MMIVDINPSESDNDIMIVMTMIMILLPSDNCTVCLYSILLQQISSLQQQQLYSQSRKKGKKIPRNTHFAPVLEFSY